MGKIIFCDKNKELIEKVKEVFNNILNNTHCELVISDKTDILECKKDYPNAKIVTASNPKFQPIGGLDKVLADRYPEQWKNPREFLTTDDLFFVISCDENIKSYNSIIKRALLGVYFASRNNDIILTGIGTSIAGLNMCVFLDVLKLFINADFSYANFNNADFRNTNFNYADFSYANFNNADFRNTNFNYADFRNADFNYVNFNNANFNYVNFRNADFRNADFRNVDFSYANFNNANFSYADFNYAKFNYRIYPEEGKFIGWKKTNQKILKLEIQDAKNVSGGLVGRKLRTDKVKVLEIQEIDGTKSSEQNVCSDHNIKFIYKLGKIIKEKNFIRDDKIECAAGIHFFITRDEAVRY